MTMTFSPVLQPEHDEYAERPTLVLDLPEPPAHASDNPLLDPTQGRKISSDPYDDPAQGQKIGSHPYDDPTSGRGGHLGDDASGGALCRSGS
jgi:hypothetical protein